MGKKVLVWICILAIGSLIACKQQKKKESYNRNLFSLLPASETGIYFSNDLRESDQVNIVTYEYMYNGGGVAIGDINNDGLPDILFTATNQSQNKLYLNKGNFKFEDISAKTGIGEHKGFSTGSVMVDINNDGLLDIFICQTGKFVPPSRKKLLYINKGNLTFVESAHQYGLDDESFTNHAAFFDYDRDGDLDVYLVNHPLDFKYSNTIILEPDTQRQYVSDRLYRNNNNGTFTDVTIAAGVSNKAYGLSATVGDINQDGWPDIYVANDYIQPDYLYINNHDGTFTESLKNYMKHCSHFGMGSDIADFNNDGLLDIMVLDMVPEDNKRQKMFSGVMFYDRFWMQVKYGLFYQYQRNCLQLNNGNGSFSEIGQMAGIYGTDWSWSPLFADLDNDGYKDIYITNGYRRDVNNLDYAKYILDSINKKGGTNIGTLQQIIPSQKLSDYVYKNNGDLTFAKVTGDWGFDNPNFGNGAAYSDLDNDGDLDVVVNNIDEQAFVYRNNSREQNANNYIQFKFKGDAKNINGVGASVKIETDSGIQYHVYTPSIGFLSSVENRVHFGIGKEKEIKRAEVTWADGSKQIMENLKANQLIVAEKKNAAKIPESKKPELQKLFTDITVQSGADFKHSENDYIDFKKEPLLPQKFSQGGPPIAPGDVNGDGTDDFYIGGATGNSGALYLQSKAGKFSKGNNSAIEKDKKYEDMGALFFDSDSDGDKDLYVVSGGNEFEESSPDYQDRLYINDGKGNFSKANEALPEMPSSGSCVIHNDYDNDGDEDLFIGGRILSGKYPLSPRSYILQNDKGKFTDVTATVCKELEYPGMVTSAIWTDTDNDKQKDLVITGQWMKVTVYKNSNGKLIRQTGNGLDSSDGWWNIITAADMDGDGDEDLIAGNLGWNSRIKAYPNQPACVYAQDFDNNGSEDAIMCYYIQGTSYPIHPRDMLLDQVRVLRKKFLRYEPYSTATIYDIFPKEQVDKSLILYARTFTTSYLENKGNGKFEIKPLPTQAQISPVYCILTDDYNKDGKKDILIAGNSYATEVETGRYDAGIGLYLQGDGKGNFNPIRTTESGFFADRDVKSMVEITSAKDQKKIILIGNNNDKMQVVKNNLD